jgi:hypothetical protein
MTSKPEPAKDLAAKLQLSTPKCIKALRPLCKTIEGKLDVLRVECTKCDRKGRYSVAKLIEKHGRKGNLMVWREMLTPTVRSATPAFRIAATWCAPICRRSSNA